MPYASVILPVYNAASTVERAVTSVLDQTFRDFEVIAVDDGSTDASRTILERLAQNDSRLRVVAHQHTGIVPSLNAAIEHASGDILIRMDADDYCRRDRFEKQLAMFAHDPNLGVVASRVAFGGEDKAAEGYRRYVNWTNALLSHQDIVLNRFVESPLAHPSTAFKRALVTDFGAYRDGRFPEDYEFWLRLLDHGVRFAKHPDTLLVWSDPPKRLSRTDARYAVDTFYRLKAKFLARDLARGLNGRPVIVWGSGRVSRQRASHLLDAGITFHAYIDVSPRKIGTRIDGIPVIAIENCPPPGDAFILFYVGVRGARELARQALSERGYREGDDFLLCA